ncbi:hypothetical protein HDV03_003494 [Kappamyces sp. JEL0829]|nr:hypothetical protein HDV03_003494 [Kappamyces sp. JEL0829]
MVSAAALLSALVVGTPVAQPSADGKWTSLLNAKQMASFVKTNGTQLSLAGKPFYFGGVNHYGLFYHYDVDIPSFFQDAVDARASVVRTWLWCDGRDCGSTSYSSLDFWFTTKDPQTGNLAVNDDPLSGLGRFDNVILQAKKFGIKLMVTLTGNWDDFGGIDFYVQQWGSAKQYHAEFYSNPDVKAQFKRYIAHVLNHVNPHTGLAYKDEPTIMGIELVNEARCIGSNNARLDPKCNSQMITAWADEISTFIKGIDQNHLISIGDEGFFDNRVSSGYPDSRQYHNVYSNLYDGSSGVDFLTNANLASIDIVGFHSYMDQWNSSKETWLQYLDNTLQWIKDHNAAAKKINKPVYIGEYGIAQSDMRLKYSPPIQALVESENMAGSLAWLMLGTNNTRPCDETPDKAGLSFGFCIGNPNIGTIILNHATRMFAKSS